MKQPAQSTPESSFYCVKEASAAFGLSLAELYRLARIGEVAHFYEGRQLRFRPDDLDNFLRSEEKRSYK